MDKTKKFFRCFGKATYIILIRWGILAIASIFLVWYLQYRVDNNNAEAAWAFMDEKPVTFWYSSLIIFSIVALLYGILHAPFKSIGFAFAIVTIITYINNAKMSFRGAPLLPEDFQLSDQAGTLTKFIDVGALVRIILASLLSIGLGFFLDYLTKRRLAFLPTIPKITREKPKAKKAIIRRRKIICLKTASVVLPRLIIIPLAISSFFTLSDFLLHREGGQFQEVAWLDNTEFIAWNQTANYAQNGFILGFLYNCSKTTLEEPADYSKEKVAEIKSEYQKEANSEPNSRLPKLDNADYNIIMVLDESFYDMSLIRELYPFDGDDTLPTFHSLMKEYPAGYMYSIDYGGGTANIEFEADTGLSNYWAKTVPYTDILPKVNDIISFAKKAKSEGYQTTAIHSFTGDMYKRNVVLKKEGFDRFITEPDMVNRERDGHSEYINDRSVYQEAMDIIRESEEKQFISLITMQNHAPYRKSNYDPEDYHFEFAPEGWDEDSRDAVLAYLESAYRSDLHLGEFLENLKSSNEKTVVLFYGDHAPGIFNDVRQGEDQKIINATQLTPYFIWANFEMTGDIGDKKYSEKFLLEDFEYSKYITLPTTTPNCLVNTLYNALGLRRNEEQILMKKLCEENPILATYYFGDREPVGEALKNYELLNYDLLGGEQYWLK